MKRNRQVVLLLAFFSLLFVGCQRRELNEGNCVFSVGIEDLPQEMLMIEENARTRMEILVHLRSEVGGKKYSLILNADNDYKETAYLQGGKYKITDCSVQPKGLVEMQVGVSDKEFTLAPGRPRGTDVEIKNIDEFNDWVWNMQMQRKVGQMDCFSRKVQLDGEIIKLRNIRKIVGFSRDSAVKAKKKATLTNSDEQIEIVVRNDTSKKQPWTACQLESVTFKKNNVIFGGGGRVGMAPYDIVNCEKGLYHTPDSMRGSVLLGEDFEGTSAVYEDSESGDRLIFKISADGTYISQITYEFETGKKAGGKS
ncbi:MAG: hypothetical protein ACI4HI_05280 [Lachnospiraceae bacterium]